MKIEKFNTIILKVPLNKPMKTRFITFVDIHCLLIIIKTDKGIEGQGLVRATSLANVVIIEKFVNTIFGPQITENNFNSAEEMWQILWLNKRNHLQSSLGLYALAAIDIAIWDIIAKIADKPLYKLFNIQQDYVIPYGNIGGINNTDKEIQANIAKYLDQGCTQFKLHIGNYNDHARIKFIYNNFGEKISLAVDANQCFEFDSALKMTSYLADFNIVWFEEPLFSNSIVGLAKLAKLSKIPIATGENMNSHLANTRCMLS